jgi:hypothetical protein
MNGHRDDDLCLLLFVSHGREISVPKETNKVSEENLILRWDETEINQLGRDPNAIVGKDGGHQICSQFLSNLTEGGIVTEEEISSLKVDQYNRQT